MKNILCFGDSNTWGYDYTQYDISSGLTKRMAFGERWTGILQNKLGSDYRIIEEAMNGRTTICYDPFFPNVKGMDALKAALDSHAPLDMVILQLGVNDLKHMFQLTAGMIAYGIEQMICEIQKSYYGYPVPQVLLIAPSPVRKEIAEGIFGFSYGPLAYEKSCQFGVLYQKAAEDHGCLFVDCGKMNFSLNDLDGLHYSREDHKKLGEAVYKKVCSAFGD
ncbi:MAG: GDSL-type esterase/lipase family protein [Eubacteriales bacterium]|nr:GDSL-type esterase/lipase family protein [Eubacteriales bacterium]